jgi:hypothetical protein
MLRRRAGISWLEIMAGNERQCTAINELLATDTAEADMMGQK